MKKIIITSLITFLSILLLQVFYIRMTSGDNLTKTIATIRYYPDSPSKMYEFDENLKITKLKTGYSNGSPAISFKIKNVSDKDNKNDNNLKVVFIIDNKVYDDKFEFVTNINRIIPSGVEKDFKIVGKYTDRLFSRMIKKGDPNTKAIIYLNNKKYKELPIRFVILETGGKMFKR